MCSVELLIPLEEHHFKIERALSASLIWNHKYDVRPKLHDPKFNYHFIRSILKSQYLIAQIHEVQDFGQYQYLLNQVAKFAKQWLFFFHFSAMWLVSLKKALKSDWLFCFTVPFSLAEKKMDLGQKIVWFVNKSHHWEPSTLQGYSMISKRI